MNIPANLYPVVVSIEVKWGEMDALGHVNNIYYFQYFETARIAYFDQLKMGPVTTVSESGPILANISCNYKKPLVYPDKIFVASSVTKVGNSSFQMSQQIYSTKYKEIVAEGSCVIVMVNYKTGEKIRVSDEIRKNIQSIEELA